jgi:hypothetical protein
VELAAIREAAGGALAELDRVSNEIEIFFMNVEPHFVTVSEDLAEHRDVLKARDALWRTISEQRSAMEVAVARQAALGAGPIARRDPQLHAEYQAALRALGELRMRAFADLIDETQKRTVALDRDLAGYSSAVLGNALRAALQQVLADTRERRAEELADVRERLSALLVVAR